MEAIAQKSSPVVAIISHFVPQRMAFIRELQKYIKVDVFGRVANRQCPGDEIAPYDKENCAKALAKKYWFYLAIENSNCTDYVTEKVFRTLKYSIVPISVSGDWEDNLVPPNSTIRYRSADGGVKELARRLNELIREPQNYLRLLEWKTRSDIYKPKPEHPICTICHALHDPELLPLHQFGSADDFYSWVKATECKALQVD